MGYFVLQTGAGADSQNTAALFTPNTATTGVPGTDPSDSPYNGRQFSWLPFDTTLQRFIRRVTAAPGSGKTANMRVHQGQGGIISPIYQIVGAVSTDVSADIEEDMPALDPTSDTTIQATISYISSWPSTSGNAAGAGFSAYEYLTITHPEVVWFVTSVGGALASATFGAADAYAVIVENGLSSSHTTQNTIQVPMPIKGRVKYAWAVWRGFTNTTTVEAFLQKGTLGAGADTALGFTMVGAGTTTPYQATIDTTTSVSIASGEYLNWRFKRTAGAATTGAIQLGFGFAPGL